MAVNKKSLSERDICTQYISPAVQQAGWDFPTQVREEVTFTAGQVIVKGKTIRRGKYDYYGASGVIDSVDDFLFDKPLLLIGEDGANLIARSKPIAFIAKGKYWVNNHAHVLDSISFDVLRYLEVFINSIDLKPYVTGTAQPKMNQAKMNSINVAFPPREEQKRIVAKVDELMVLCDDLEAKLTQQQGDADRLTEAMVAAVLGNAAA